jgi:Protein of unknown function (DUF3768)
LDDKEDGGGVLYRDNRAAGHAPMAGTVCEPASSHHRHRTKAPDGIRAPTQQCGAAMSADRIRELNDAFRSTFRGGKVMMTSGVDELPDCVKAGALVEVAKFSNFTPDNDPHGEHDFGSFTLVGRKFFWKIDLYEEPDVKTENGEPAITRVLTIMLADEY